MIRTLPKFPNNKNTKAKLEQMSLATLLIHYMSWVSRYVSTKPRAVSIEPSAEQDPRWLMLQPQIQAFLGKVVGGEDLTPHLSSQAHSRGYTPTAAEKGPDVDRWADKDFFLNAMGYHHFHLGMAVESRRYATRTDDVLFAQVTREKFIVVGIFDHTVFEPGGQEMSDERKRLWTLFDEHVTRGAPPGSVVLASPIATSGHPIHIVSTAQEYSRIIHQVDPKLGDGEFIAELYRDSGMDLPKNLKFEWALNYSDLGVFEKRNGHYFVFRRGFN